MKALGRPSVGAALAITMLLALALAPALTLASGGPAIASDKDDYAPAEVATLTGTGWGAGEAVRIIITGSDGLVHADDTVAAGVPDGSFVYLFRVPPQGVERFHVRATGESGAAAETLFTDANLQYSTAKEPGSGFAPVKAGELLTLAVGARQLTLGGITPVVNDVPGAGFGVMARYPASDPDQLNLRACGTVSGPAGADPVAGLLLPTAWLSISASPGGSPGLPYRMPARSDPAVPEDPYHLFAIQVAPPADAEYGLYSAAVKFEGTATGNQWFALCIEVTEPAAVAAIDVETLVSVDGGGTWLDADVPPGPDVLGGHQAPRVRSTITNTGDVPLTGVSLSDSASDLSGCVPDGPLAAGASVECVAELPWVEGQRLSTVTASGMAGATEVTDRDDTHWYGAVAGIDIEMSISVDGGLTWHEADGPPGPIGLSLTASRLRFAVRNTGNTLLTELGLASRGLDLGGCALAGALAAGATAECAIAVPWALGQQAYSATVSGRHVDSAGNVAQPSDSDRSHDFGMPAAAVTDGSLCLFDRVPTAEPWPADRQQFRLVFTPGGPGGRTHKLSAANPGQFFYDAIATGTPGDVVEMTLTLPFPFVTRGASPLRVYDGAGLDLSGPVPCLEAGDPIPGAAGGVKTVTMGNFYRAFGDTAVVTATLTMPASGVLLLVLHLDYGLEKTGGYVRDGSDNAERPPGSDAISNRHGHVFSYSLNGLSASTTVENVNAFK